MPNFYPVEASERDPLLPNNQIFTSDDDIDFSRTGKAAATSEPLERGVDEESFGEPTTNEQPKPHSSVASIISVLLIGKWHTTTSDSRINFHILGVFISNADGSLLLATHPAIASEFNALGDSSWLLTSFALASAGTQPLYGKLSDIYGRKKLLVLAYSLFCLGL